ncbi:MAG: hypothetical protein P8Y03_22650 [Anaerolineales bacterium]|jgi:hypothetical protein
MKEKKQVLSRWFYAIAILVVLLGLLASAWILKTSGIATYATRITDTFSEAQHRLSVPGSRDVKLTRTGAYGIYYEYSPASSSVDCPQWVPAIDCSLTSQSTGAKLQAVPDYVETNRYEAKNQDRIGVLIMSLTVHKPDTYTFACRYQNEAERPDITVALSPNYAWEVLRVAGKGGLALFGGMTVTCGSMLFGLVIVVIVAVKRRGF